VIRSRARGYLAIIKVIGRIAWKHGVYEKVPHEVDADGSHRIVNSDSRP
jgi:hypothetical protein